MIDYQIQYDGLALLLLGVTGLYFILQPKHPSLQRDIFINYYWVVFISTLLDIVTVMMMWHREVFPPWALYGVNVLYWSLSFLIPSIIAHYARSLAANANAIRTGFLWYLPVVACIFLVIFVNPFTGWFMQVTADGTYIRGDWVLAFPVLMVFYIIDAIIHLVRGRRFISRVQKATVLGASAIIVGLGLIQVFHPQYLLGGVIASLSVLMVYFSFQSFDDKIDPLTALPNLEGFYTDARRLMEQNPDTGYYTIGMIDLQHFKMINDLFGKKAGDAVLLDFAGRLRRRAGENGCCGRAEADHFVFCIPTGLVKARWRDSGIVHITQPVDYKLRMRVGLYTVEDPQLPVGQMCDRAQMAMETVRYNYVDYTAWYDESLRQALMEEQRIADEMEQALAEDQFYLKYQPIVRLADGRIAMAEALVRWKHPELGEIPPSVFIPQFEKNGFITALDAKIREAIFANLSRWQEAGRTLVPISVNFSLLDFAQDDLVGQLEALSRKYAVDPEYFKVEITESVYMENPQQIRGIIDALHRGGFQVFMDDFGSGYSSLNVLKDVPMDVLKLDLAFLKTEDAANLGRSRIILQSVIAMAGELGMGTITEGIDAREQIETLCAMGSTYGQGYYFAKPLYAGELGKRLEDQQAH